MLMDYTTTMCTTKYLTVNCVQYNDNISSEYIQHIAITTYYHINCVCCTIDIIWTIHTGLEADES